MGEGLIQEFYEVGYDFESIYDLIIGYLNNDNEYLIAYFIAEEVTNFVPANNYDINHNIMIMLEHISEKLDQIDFNYSRYLPLYLGYWHYYKTRMMMKVMLLFFQDIKILTQRGFFVQRVSDNTLEQYFAADVNEKTKKLSYWHSGDFIFCNGRSLQDKDLIEADKMYQYLKKIGFY